jgi:hypothetical protein
MIFFSFFFSSDDKLTGQEAVKLDQELQVDIVALGGLAVSALDVVAVEIDTWKLETVSARWFMLKCGCSSSRKRASRSQRDTQGIITTRIRRLCQFFHVPMATTGAEKLDDGLESRSRKCLGIQANFPTKNFRAFDVDCCSDWPAVELVIERSVAAIRVCLADSASPL